jgi:DNA-binding CsgD family transcriptional regulator
MTENRAASSRTHDVLTLLEKAYDLAEGEERWLQALSDAALPLMDAGFGTFSWKVDLRSMRIVSFVTSAAPEWVSKVVGGIHAAASPAEFAKAAGRRYSTLSQQFGGKQWLDLEITKRHVLPYGIEDAKSVNIVDPAGRFVLVLGAPLRTAAAPRKTEQSRWDRLASHLGAACRLRERLATQNSEADGEALLTPAGRIDHAYGKARSRTAREALHEAVLSRERALGRPRRSKSDGSLDLWRALVEGRWSLVDRFDTGGRRYVVAHVNEMGVPGPRSLTAQERNVVAMVAQAQPLKIIAYELGLSMSTVSGCLHAAMRKLGIGSRTELIGIFAALRERTSARSAGTGTGA